MNEAYVELAQQYGVLAGLVLSVVLFVVASALWASGHEPIAGLLGVLSLVWPLAVLAVAFDGIDESEAEQEDPREAWRKQGRE